MGTDGVKSAPPSEVSRLREALSEFETALHVWMQDNTGAVELDLLERLEYALAALSPTKEQP